MTPRRLSSIVTVSMPTGKALQKSTWSKKRHRLIHHGACALQAKQITPTASVQAEGILPAPLLTADDSAICSETVPVLWQSPITLCSGEVLSLRPHLKHHLVCSLGV